MKILQNSLKRLNFLSQMRNHLAKGIMCSLPITYYIKISNTSVKSLKSTDSSHNLTRSECKNLFRCSSIEMSQWPIINTSIERSRKQMNIERSQLLSISHWLKLDLLEMKTKTILLPTLTTYTTNFSMIIANSKMMTCR